MDWTTLGGLDLTPSDACPLPTVYSLLIFSPHEVLRDKLKRAFIYFQLSPTYQIPTAYSTLENHSPQRLDLGESTKPDPPSTLVTVLPSVLRQTSWVLFTVPPLYQSSTDTGSWLEDTSAKPALRQETSLGCLWVLSDACFIVLQYLFQLSKPKNHQRGSSPLQVFWRRQDDMTDTRCRPPDTLHIKTRGQCCPESSPKNWK